MIFSSRIAVAVVLLMTAAVGAATYKSVADIPPLPDPPAPTASFGKLADVSTPFPTCAKNERLVMPSDREILAAISATSFLDADYDNYRKAKYTLSRCIPDTEVIP